VPGFGGCGTCPFRQTATYDICFACARTSLTALPPRHARCHVCDRPYEPGERQCRNGLCRSERWFSWNYAIALRDERLRGVIERYKFEGRWGWAIIFGRILVGALELDAARFRGFDLIIPSPDSPGGFKHAARVIEEAAKHLPAGADWPFYLGDPVIAKTRDTPRLSQTKGLQERVEVATSDLRSALTVVMPRLTEGRRILVYDDTFTTGNTLNEVARALRTQGGAAEVCGITLCRQPWKGSP
jgi:predicted amidophosphoribosyltransferase